MPQISIQNTIIDFPESAQSPNWSESLIQFATAVELALASVVGPYDVPSQILNIDAYNPGTNVEITALNFPSSEVRAAFIRYAVYRETSVTSTYEAGTLDIAYNPNGPVNNKWEIVRESGAGGDGQIEFIISDVGQMYFTTTTLSGINHVGNLTFVAQSVLQSS